MSVNESFFSDDVMMTLASGVIGKVWDNGGDESGVGFQATGFSENCYSIATSNFLLPCV